MGGNIPYVDVYYRGARTAGVLGRISADQFWDGGGAGQPTGAVCGCAVRLF
jgi:hypothetical protein